MAKPDKRFSILCQSNQQTAMLLLRCEITVRRHYHFRMPINKSISFDKLAAGRLP